MAGGQALTQTHHYLDAAGIEHRVQFREIDPCHGEMAYELIVDDVIIPQLDVSLYKNLLGFSERMLADYFSHH